MCHSSSCEAVCSLKILDKNMDCVLIKNCVLAATVLTAVTL